MKDINKIETVCIFYRVTGRWNWLGKIMTDPKIYGIAIVLYFILITNMGFEDRMWNNIENNNNSHKNVYIINGITLLSIIVYYIIDRIGGKVINKLIKNIYSESAKVLIPGEFGDILYGLAIYGLIQTILSIIFSGLIYYKKIEKNENYILSINIGSIEYLKISILEIISFYFETNVRSLEFFSSSTILSVYFLIWNIIIFIINIFDVENKSIIFFHFIFGIIYFGLIILVMCLIIIFYLVEEKMKTKDQKS